MAFVGSLSSSLGTTTIAVTGSLVPGTANDDLGTTGSKWRTVFATNITGSLTRLAGGGEYLKPGSNVTLTTGSDGSVTIAAAGGGGGGAGVFTESDASAAFTTSSIAIGFGAAASTKGSDVFFAVSGSDAAANKTTFSGPVVASGSLEIKNVVSNATVASISFDGIVSGSALQTGGNLAVQGTSALTGDVTFGGNIVADANEAKSIFTAVTSNPITVGGAGSSVDVAGTLKVSGNQISGSAGGNLQLGAAGNVAVAGDLTVLGNDIVFSAGTGNIATAATTLTVGSSTGVVVIPGDLEVQGTTMTVSASNLVIEDPLVGFGFLSASVPGSSTGDRGFVGGYTGAGNNVAFGYSLSNTAFVATKTTDNATATTFAVSELLPIRANSFQVNGSTAKVTSSNGDEITVVGGASATLSAAGSVAIAAGGTSAVDVKFGASTFLQITGSGGNPSLISSGDRTLTLSGSALRLEGNTGTGIAFRLGGAAYATLVNSGTDTLFGALGSKFLILSGGLVNLTSGPGGISFQNLGTTFAAFSSSGTAFSLQPGVGFTTANLATVDATTVNLGSAATTRLNMGNSSGQTWISGSVSVPGTFSALGNINLGDTNADRLNIVAAVTSSIIPSDDVAFTLGTADKRWQHIYTGDLHLRNERGDYTLIEESDFLSIRFNKNGKRYKFLLERVPELDEPSR